MPKERITKAFLDGKMDLIYRLYGLECDYTKGSQVNGNQFYIIVSDSRGNKTKVSAWSKSELYEKLDSFAHGYRFHSERY